MILSTKDVGVNYSDGSSESYTYEPVSGRRLTATNENGTTTYEKENRGQGAISTYVFVAKSFLNSLN